MSQHLLTPQDAASLGPLAGLCGAWEGDKGTDVAPSPSRDTVTCQYRERTVFTPAGRVDNHEQVLYGLKFSTVAWRLDEPTSFHEEFGIWLWDAARGQVLRCFVVPRGISVIAGGACAADATTIAVAATLGSTTYGILSNQFLDAEFRTLAYELSLTVEGDTLRYATDTVLQLKGRGEPFHHRDGNTLRRVPA